MCYGLDSEVFESMLLETSGDESLNSHSPGAKRRRQFADVLVDPPAITVSAQAALSEHDVMAAFAEHQDRFHRTPRRSKSTAS